MTDSQNCGFDPTWKGRDCGNNACFGGRCVFDTCTINQTSTHTRIDLGIGNGTNVYYLAWYYAKDGTNPPDSIALASTVPPNLGLTFAPSNYNPGFYDLKIDTISGYLGYSPTTGYMVWNQTAGPDTGIWRADGCDGDIVMTYKGQTYHFATDENNFAIALPDTTNLPNKRSSATYSNFVPFAIRNKMSFTSARRCQSGSPAQKVPLNDPRLEPNGCGSLKTKRFIPQYRFGVCCNSHDTCYSTCARDFLDCNNDFYTCMIGVCEDLKPTQPIEAQACHAAAAWYAGWVFSPVGLGIFISATHEACETCPEDKPKDLCGKYHGSDGARCECAGYLACDWCECKGWAGQQIG
jgi:hypothetical protein